MWSVEGIVITLTPHEVTAGILYLVLGFPDGKECGETEGDPAEGHQDGLEPKGH